MLDWIGIGIGISLNSLTTRSPYGDKNVFVNFPHLDLPCGLVCEGGGSKYR